MYSLPRTARLTAARQYAAAFRSETVSGAMFQVWFRPNGQHHARLGVVVSKRAAPRAVDRNFVKRLIREGFRREQQHLNGLDIVVRLRKKPVKAKARAMREELAVLFSKNSSWVESP